MEWFWLIVSIIVYLTSSPLPQNSRSLCWLLSRSPTTLEMKWNAWKNAASFEGRCVVVLWKCNSYFEKTDRLRCALYLYWYPLTLDTGSSLAWFGALLTRADVGGAHDGRAGGPEQLAIFVHHLRQAGQAHLHPQADEHDRWGNVLLILSLFVVVYNNIPKLICVGFCFNFTFQLSECVPSVLSKCEQNMIRFSSRSFQSRFHCDCWSAFDIHDHTVLSTYPSPLSPWCLPSTTPLWSSSTTRSRRGSTNLWRPATSAKKVQHLTDLITRIFIGVNGFLQQYAIILTIKTIQVEL